MLFLTPEFALFFGIATVLFFVVPACFRWALILVSSYVFCLTWGIQSAVILLISTIINYLFGRLIGVGTTARRRTTYLGLGIVSNVLLLGIFKYFNFFDDLVASVF